MSATKNVANEL